MGKSIQLKNNENEKMYPHPYYPVGSIYLSVNDTNPSYWFGGTWELIAQGRTLVGVDTNDTDFNTVKKTGGSKYLQSHNHNLNEAIVWDNTDNLGNTWWVGIDGTMAGGNLFNSNNDGLVAQWMGHGNFYSQNTGDGDSGNLQPYFTCYIWCRTA